MTDPKKPTVIASNPKKGGESGNAFFVMRLIHEPVLPQDVYSPNEVAKLLSISKKRVYYYAGLERNPLPLRRWPNGARGSFVLRDEFIEWLREYTIANGRLPSDEGADDNEQTR